jgi:hypothetical protein
VLHGSVARPCLAAWSAVGLAPLPGSISAIVTGDSARAWLFRRTPGRGRALDVRPMSCRYSPGAAVPKEIWAALGASLEPR